MEGIEMTDEIRKILKMTCDGKISHDEAVRLLDATTKTAPTEQGGAMYSQDPPPDVDETEGAPGHSLSPRRRIPRWCKVLGAVMIVVLLSPLIWIGASDAKGIGTIGMVEMLVIMMIITFIAAFWRAIIYAGVRIALWAHRRHHHEAG
jgi:hypothetical protein